MPGEKVDKDVYAVNTGNIEAFAKATVSGVMSITREVPVPISDVMTEATSGTQTTYTPYGGGESSESMPNGYTSLLNGQDSLPLYNDGSMLVAADFVDVQADVPPGVTGYVRSGEGTFVLTGVGDFISDPYTYTFYTETPGAAGTAGGWNFYKVYDCVELTSNEVYAIEAGAYLAYKPATDEVNTTLGNKAIAFKEPNETEGDVEYEKKMTDSAGQPVWIPITKEEYERVTAADPQTGNVRKNGKSDPTNATKTDFTPHGDGLYVFRRAIVVAPGDNKPGSSVAAGTETFEYEGYYFLGGKYYKIMNHL